MGQKPTRGKGEGGGSLILSYSFVFQKTEYFLGSEDFVDIFWGIITKLDYI